MDEVSASVRPFRPYWTNRFADWVERSPIPAWLFYVLLLLITGLFSNLYMWAIGALPWGDFELVILLTGFWAIEALAFSHYLMGASERAFDDFALLLQADPDEAASLRYEFSHLPRTRAIFWASLGLLFGAFMAVYQPAALGDFERPFLINALSWIPAQFFVFEFVYRLIYQLRFVGILYAAIPKLDIFHLGPVHSLAGFSARAGLLILVFAYVNPAFVYTPNILSDPVFFMAGVTLSGLAIAAFFIPLLGIRSRLTSEKERIQARLGKQMDTARRRLEQRMDDEEYENVLEIRHALRAFLDLDAKVNSISVWPWSLNTLRGFLSAVLLPIILWLIQQVLARMLEF